MELCPCFSCAHARARAFPRVSFRMQREKGTLMRRNTRRVENRVRNTYTRVRFASEGIRSSTITTSERRSKERVRFSHLGNVRIASDRRRIVGVSATGFPGGETRRYPRDSFAVPRNLYRIIGSSLAEDPFARRSTASRSGVRLVGSPPSFQNGVCICVILRPFPPPRGPRTLSLSSPPPSPRRRVSMPGDRPDCRIALQHLDSVTENRIWHGVTMRRRTANVSLPGVE